MAQTVYKIVPTNIWQQARQKGQFDGASIDLTDGFIHLSTAAQVPGTAARFFAGQQGLTLVAIDAATLGDALVYEASPDGGLFPHLYAFLPLSSVLSEIPMPVGADGLHLLPELAP